MSKKFTPHPSVHGTDTSAIKCAGKYSRVRTECGSYAQFGV